MKLYGRQWTRRELEARLGRLEQIGGIRRMKLLEGTEAEVEQIQVRTGSGLSYYVSPSRALDISLAEFGGVPFSWQSINGDVHPAYYDSKGAEWLRSAAGGLLMTCGLTQVGSSAMDGTEELGLHGRIHHTPARQVVAEGNWCGDEYELRIRGIVEEVSIFGTKLRLTREIHSKLGENRIRIHDIVENIGFYPCPHMILYHFNFGFPLMSDHTKITFPSAKVAGKNSEAYGPEGHENWQAPELDYPERVFYHNDLTADSNGFTSVVISNPEFPLHNATGAGAIQVRLSWERNSLPQLVQWKMPDSGEYVLGIEPSNCSVEGRIAEREKGNLTILQPGEQKIYKLELEVSEG